MRTSVITGSSCAYKGDWSSAHSAVSYTVEAKEKGAFGLPSTFVGLLSCLVLLIVNTFNCQIDVFLGPDDYRGGDGPLHVSRGKSNNPLYQAFIDAGVQAGYPFTEDMNGYQQEGFGWMDMTIHKGVRWNTANAYLRPALKRPNLRADTKAMITRIVFENNRAVGVEYHYQNQLKRVRARKGVILTSGAINTPQLLNLSGVGNADDLKKLGIPVKAHLPGVGQNLQDHLEMYFHQVFTFFACLFYSLS